MRINSIQLIKLFGTRTDPAIETKSIGLPADARGVMVFATRQFYRDTQIAAVYWTSKNHATATQTPTNQTAGPLGASSLNINNL